jgi:beta-1,4-N-acetylglucosaminyltransferase
LPACPVCHTHTHTHTSSCQWCVEKIPRSREVRESVLSSLVHTLQATLFAVPLVLRHLPDVVLVNGPGTCVCVCLCAYLPRILGIKHIKVVYVESVCRVRTLSLSGKLLYPFCDLFVVQWESLRDKYPRAVYLGRFL